MKNPKKLLLLAALTLSAATAAAQDPETDWANFGRFEAENAALAASPEVVLMGNSITEGWIRLRPGFFAENGYVSRAISGQTTSQMLVRFRADVLDLHPQVVVICGGTNDIAQNTGYISLPHILGNLVSMVELARANGIAPVLCSLLPAREFGWRKELEPAPLIIELNAMIREYARRENVPYVDYHAAMSEADGGMVAAYTYDEVHPTAAGYDVMEQILPPVVDAVLKNPKRYRRR